MATDKPSDTTGLRWCEACKQYHGPLYICPSYSDEVKRELAIKGHLFRQWLRNKIREDQIHDARN